MLTRPDQQGQRALANLTRTPAWLEVEKLLEAEVGAIVDRMLTDTDEVAMRRAQGAANWIKDFLKTAQSAREQGNTLL